MGSHKREVTTVVHRKEATVRERCCLKYRRCGRNCSVCPLLAAAEDCEAKGGDEPRHGQETNRVRVELLLVRVAEGEC